MFRSCRLTWVIIASSALSLIAAVFFPIILDESYYFLWAKRLALGYFDHPPGVAYLSALGYLLPLQYLGPRLGTVLLGIASLLLALRLFWACGLRSLSTLFIASLLFKASIGGISSGFLATPDALLIFFWLLALHEALFALKGEERRWLSAGLATGCGLLSKYAMVLIGPIFLFALWQDPRHSLRRPWPYLGGFLAFLILAPNLYWNASHGWHSFAFQLRRLLPITISEQVDLPTPLLDVISGPEWELAQKLARLEVEQSVDTLQEDEEENKGLSNKIRISLGSEQKLITRILEFLGGLLILWGFLLIPLTGLLRCKRHDASEVALDPQAQRLLNNAVWVPIIFFGIISLFTKVEANWTAIYMLAAAPLMAPYLLPKIRSITIAALLNALVILLLVVHGVHPLWTQKNDYILKETSGFEKLAQYVRTLEAPLFVDSYQLLSMIRFYQPQQLVYQWPGINRPSEWTTNSALVYPPLELQTKKEFWLLSTESIPPRFASFQPITMERIRDCAKEGFLQIHSSRPQHIKERCHAVHTWTLVHYSGMSY